MRKIVTIVLTVLLLCAMPFSVLAADPCLTIQPMLLIPIWKARRTV